MSRVARKKSSTLIYHVVIKGADRQLLFEERKDYLKYLEILAFYKEECKFKILAYCLMSNHVHLLIRHSPEIPLDAIFRRINTTYAGWFNTKYNRTGFVQDGRYHSEPVETERYLRCVIHYIHNNPSKAGLERGPGGGYPWSSYKDYQNGRSSLTDTEEVYKILGTQAILVENADDEMNDACLDIDQVRKRISDDAARDIIKRICGCSTATEFQKLPTIQRNKIIVELGKEGISIRQMNRLTGVSRGAIEKILKKENS